jgi:hypothetical protein
MRLLTDIYRHRKDVTISLTRGGGTSDQLGHKVFCHRVVADYRRGGLFRVELEAFAHRYADSICPE